ncbi:MAG: c-type cytochrome [Deltaproteobacteria bacterium]|nr:c-type cytochrome [Deltaproteobacteria bacterium]
MQKNRKRQLLEPNLYILFESKLSHLHLSAPHLQCNESSVAQGLRHRYAFNQEFFQIVASPPPVTTGDFMKQSRIALSLALAFAAAGQVMAAPQELSQPFELHVDMIKAEPPRRHLDAKHDAVTNSVVANAGTDDFVVYGAVKALADTLDRLQVDVYIENRHDYPLDDVALEISEAGSSGTFVNLTTDAYSQAKLTAPTSLYVGRMAPFGMKRVTLGLGKSLRPEIVGRIVAREGSGSGQTSTNILVAPTGDELWAVSTDTDEVVVYGLPGRDVMARIPVGRAPASLALQAAKNWIVVASAKGNTVTVIDRETKRVLSVLGAKEEFGRELQQVIVSQREPKIYVSSYVEGLLTELRLGDDARLVSSRSLSIGARPTGMSMTYDESNLYVAHFLPRGDIKHNESWISVISLADFRAEKDAIIEDHFNPDNPRMQCLADFYSSYLPTKLVYGQLQAKDFSLEGTASQLSGVFLDPAGQTAWVPGTRITGALVVLERGANADKSLTRFGGLQPAQLSAPLIFPMDASRKSELHELFTRDVEMAIPSLKRVVYCMRHPLEIEFIDRTLISGGKEQINQFLAYGVPHAGLTGLGLVNTIAFTKGGRFALMLSHVSDEIAIYDATTIHPASQLHFQLSGSNPKGMTVSPDGKKVYVLYENSDFISEVDASSYAPDDSAQLARPYEIPYRYAPTTKSLIQLGGVLGLPLIRNIEKVAKTPELREIAQLKLRATDPLGAELRRGKVLFESANPDKYPVSVNRLGACASCHPNGGNDGSSWVTMEGPRRTMSLRGGVADRGWLHSSATHTNALEFVETIVPERLGGKLGDEDTKAMAAYLERGVAKLQAPRVDAALAARGKELFTTNCASCHRGTASTSGVKADGTPRLYDIGTSNPDHGVAAGRFANKLIGLADPKSQEIAESLIGDRPLGGDDPVQKILDYRPRPVRSAGQFKAPSLVNAFDNAVFFHDASVGTLGEAIRHVSKKLDLSFSDEDFAALEAYVKTL